MAETIKLSEILANLSKKTPIDGTEHIIISSGAENKYIKPDELRSYFTGDDLSVRFLGTADDYDGITALVKAMDFTDLSTQGLWYASMNGVKVLLNVEIKYKGDIASAARGIVTLYGGVKVASDGSLSQDLALHILTISFNNSGWSGWKEYFNAADLTKAQADIAAVSTTLADVKQRTAAAEASIKTNATNIAANTASINTNSTNIAANTKDIAANKANIAANTAAVAKAQADIDSVTGSDRSVRFLGTADDYDGITALVKAMDFTDLSTQGLWYASMNGVKVLLNVEIKYKGDIASAARGIVTLYGGVKVASDGSLSQDLALHILTISFNNSGWSGWKEYFNAADLTKAQADITATADTIDALAEKVDNMRLWYGVEFDTAVSSPACTRIGNLELHRTLPVHSLMRGCLLDDDGKVNEYLPADSWTASVRDGSKGMVMVELPAHYRRFETEGTKRRVKLSTVSLPGFVFVPRMYVSAYQAALDRTNLKLASVVNDTAQYRGGNNNANYDGTYRSFLNRPATVISRTNFRNYARKRKEGSTEWNCMTYDMQKTLYWLFVIEYATLNSQAAYNASPTSEGYHQGGLGDGVTTLASGDWSNFNGYSPFVPCGLTDSLGNRTGVVEYTINNEAESSPITKTFQVPRYRGVENPFGHIWQWTDGINVRISPNTDNGGDGLSKVFVCSDPSKFNDSNYEGYSHVGNEARDGGYVKEVIFGEGGEIIPKAIGGGSTTYFCDYHYTNIPTTETLRGVLFGGYASYGASAGFVSALSTDAPSYTRASVGSRLCFIPE